MEQIQCDAISTNWRRREVHFTRNWPSKHANHGGRSGISLGVRPVGAPFGVTSIVRGHSSKGGGTRPQCGVKVRWLERIQIGTVQHSQLASLCSVPCSITVSSTCCGRGMSYHIANEPTEDQNSAPTSRTEPFRPIPEGGVSAPVRTCHNWMGLIRSIYGRNAIDFAGLSLVDGFFVGMISARVVIKRHSSLPS